MDERVEMFRQQERIAELDASCAVKDIEIERLRADIRCMVEKAADQHLEGYREQGRRIAELEEDVQGYGEAYTKMKLKLDAEIERLRDLIKSMGTGYDDAAIDAAMEERG